MVPRIMNERDEYISESDDPYEDWRKPIIRRVVEEAKALGISHDDFAKLVKEYFKEKETTVRHRYDSPDPNGPAMLERVSRWTRGDFERCLNEFMAGLRESPNAEYVQSFVDQMPGSRRAGRR